LIGLTAVAGTDRTKQLKTENTKYQIIASSKIHPSKIPPTFFAGPTRTSSNRKKMQQKMRFGGMPRAQTTSSPHNPEKAIKKHQIASISASPSDGSRTRGHQPVYRGREFHAA
jgi:hypothetical protein